MSWKYIFLHRLQDVDDGVGDYTRCEVLFVVIGSTTRQNYSYEVVVEKWEIKQLGTYSSNQSFFIFRW